MKIYKEEIAGSDKKRILFALGMEEVRLIYSLLRTARRYFPSGLEYSQDVRRLGNILKALSSFIHEETKDELK